MRRLSVSTDELSSSARTDPRAPRLGMLCILVLVSFVLFPEGAPCREETTPPPMYAFPEPTEEPEPPQVPLQGLALSGPVDPDEYVVGPGDVFSITIWAQDVTSLSSTVTPEGSLVLPGIAIVDVAGETLSSAKQSIRERLESSYRNVEVSIALEDVRKMAVNVLGNVEVPGVHIGTALELAGTLIARAGGLKENASKRNILITRRGGSTERVDLARYENAGDLSANPPVLDGDVIFVPFLKSRVYVHGAVGSPGGYEHVPGETVGSLIEVAGGFTEDARRDTVEVRHFISPLESRSVFVDIRNDAGRAHELGERDQLYVRSIPKWRPLGIVHLDGEFMFAGGYGINEGSDRILDVIERAGGLTDEAAIHETKLIRGSALDEVDLEYERLLELSVADMDPAEYAYYKTKTREPEGVVVVDFERLLDGDESDNVLLVHGDRIIAPRRRTTVQVTGQVAYPGRVSYVSGERYSYYLREAGGLSSGADDGKARVIRAATGERVPARRAGQLLPGDVLWVPERRETDWWQLLRDVVGLAAALATVYVVVDQAGRN